MGGPRKSIFGKSELFYTSQPLKKRVHNDWNFFIAYMNRAMNRVSNFHEKSLEN
jgi:hypothetical protein